MKRETIRAVLARVRSQSEAFGSVILRRLWLVRLAEGFCRFGLNSSGIVRFVLVLGASAIVSAQPSLAQFPEPTPQCVPSPYGCPEGPVVGPSPGPAPVYRPSSPAQRATAINNEAVALEKRRDYAGALAKFRQALKLDPSNPIIRANLAIAESRRIHNEGTALFNRGDLAGALAKYREALSFTPSKKVTRAGLARTEGTILYKRGDYAGAAAKFREALALLREVLALLPPNSKDIDAYSKALGYYRADLATAEAELAKQRQQKEKQKETRIQTTPAWNATEATRRQLQNLERLVESFPDGRENVGRAFKQWLRVKVTFDRVSRRGIPLGTSPGLLNVYDSFWTKDPASRESPFSPTSLLNFESRKSLLTSQTSLLTFELGKTLWLAINLGEPKVARTLAADRFEALMKKYPEVLELGALKSAPFQKHSLIKLADSDLASKFGYAVRVVVLDLHPTGNVAWETKDRAKAEMRQYLKSLLPR